MRGTLGGEQGREEKGTEKEGVRVSHCPKCGYEQYCPCPNCIGEAIRKEKKPWINLEGDLIKCANCGYTAHCDKWLDHEWEEFKKSEPKH